MSTVAGGVIQALSVSQVEQYDAQQTGGCPRRWYFERVEGHRPESSTAMTGGDVGHELLALHLTGQELPTRARMLKAVKGAIAAGHLPAPGPDLIIEQRFDGQPKRDAAGKWVPLRHETTLHFAGLPWDGFVDAQWRRSDVVDILDHKFSSDIDLYAKPADGLLRTVQMPVYALNALRRWPDATQFRFTHHYVSRRGVKSFVRTQVVTLAQVRERLTDVERAVTEMQSVARAQSQDDVPFNRKACAAYTGCPHQSICNAFRRNQIAMSAEEHELFPTQDKGSTGYVSDADLDELFGPPSTPSVAQVVREEPAEMPDHFPGPQGDPAATGYTIVGQTDVTAEEIPLIPLPVASKPAVQPAPVCECGAELNTGNALKLRDGTWQHTNGCPLASSTPAPVAEQPAPKRRGRPPKVKPESETPAIINPDSPARPSFSDAALRSMSADRLREMADEHEKNGDHVAAENLYAASAKARKQEAEAREAAEATPATRTRTMKPKADSLTDEDRARLMAAPEVDPRARPGEGPAVTWERAYHDANPPDGESTPNPEPLARLEREQAAKHAAEPTRLRGAPDAAETFAKIEQEGRERAWEKWKAGGMDGAPVRSHPLAGTLRVELDLSDRFAALLERVLGKLP